jgi:hypothetical protein
MSLIDVPPFQRRPLEHFHSFDQTKSRGDEGRLVSSHSRVLVGHQDMSDNRQPRDDETDAARRAESDVTAELEWVARVQDDPVETVEDLVQHPPELGYLHAELESLRDALRGASAPDRGNS